MWYLSVESELRALALSIYEGMWIQRLLKELGMESLTPIHMHCDNQAAISIAKNPVYHDRTKHIEIDQHFITKKITLFTSSTFQQNLKLQTSSSKLYQGLILKN